MREGGLVSPHSARTHRHRAGGGRDLIHLFAIEIQVVHTVHQLVVAQYRQPSPCVIELCIVCRHCQAMENKVKGENQWSKGVRGSKVQEPVRPYGSSARWNNPLTTAPFGGADMV